MREKDKEAIMHVKARELTKEEQEAGWVLAGEEAFVSFPLGYDPAPARSVWVSIETLDKESKVLYVGEVEYVDFTGLRLRDVLSVLRQVEPEGKHEEKLIAEITSQRKTDRMNKYRATLNPHRPSAVSPEKHLDKILASLTPAESVLAEKIALLKAELVARRG